MSQDINNYLTQAAGAGAFDPTMDPTGTAFLNQQAGSQGLNPTAAYQQLMVNMNAQPMTSDQVFQQNQASGGLNGFSYSNPVANQMSSNPVANPVVTAPGTSSFSTGDGGMSLNSYLASKFQGMGGTPAGSVVSQTSPGAGQYNALLQQLMQQAQAGQQQKQDQYKTLMSQIMGPNGYLSAAGKTGEAQIAQQEKNSLGGLQQNLTSRGLGNSTLSNSLAGGIQRNAQEARDNLSAAIGGQKAQAGMQLFNMNPTPGTDTYLNLLSKLGSAAGPANGAVTTQIK